MRKLLVIIGIFVAAILLLSLAKSVASGQSFIQKVKDTIYLAKEAALALLNPVKSFKLLWNTIKFFFYLMTFNSEGVQGAVTSFYEILAGTDGGSTSNGAFSYTQGN